MMEVTFNEEFGSIKMVAKTPKDEETLQKIYAAWEKGVPSGPFQTLLFTVAGNLTSPRTAIELIQLK